MSNLGKNKSNEYFLHCRGVTDTPKGWAILIAPERAKNVEKAIKLRVRQRDKGRSLTDEEIIFGVVRAKKQVVDLPEKLANKIIRKLIQELKPVLLDALNRLDERDSAHLPQKEDFLVLAQLYLSRQNIPDEEFEGILLSERMLTHQSEDNPLSSGELTAAYHRAAAVIKMYKEMPI